MNADKQVLIAPWASRVVQTIDMTTRILCELVEDIGDQHLEADETQRIQWSELLAWIRGKLDGDAEDLRSSVVGELDPAPPKPKTDS